MRRRAPFPPLACVLAALAAAGAPAAAQERWFQVEVSVFSNESPADRDAEFWRPGRSEPAYPPRMRRLDSMMDFLMIDALSGASAADRAPRPAPERADARLRLPDFERDGFLQLPESESDFRETNQALRNSAGHRLLFHGLWRQPVRQADGAEAVYVSGGRRYGGRHELEGSIAIHFNDGRDRVVAAADMWLTEFRRDPPAGPRWTLPPPAGAAPGEADGAPWHPARVYHLRQSREMRSREFHYLDHPALGLVVSVVPWEPPERAP